jgi:hypothetical protein
MEQQLNRVARAWNNVKMRPMAHGNRLKIKPVVLLVWMLRLTMTKIPELEAKIAAAGSDTEVAMQPREYQQRKRYWIFALKEKQQAEETAAGRSKAQTNRCRDHCCCRKTQKLWKGNRSELEKERDAVEETRKNYETLWKSASGRHASVPWRHFH